MFSVSGTFSFFSIFCISLKEEKEKKREKERNNSERPIDALVENGKSLTHPLTDNLKSRDASASKKLVLPHPENISKASKGSF